MKIGIIGDTHGSQQAIRKVLQLLPPVELLLHTGDYAPDANLLETLTGLPVIKVSLSASAPYFSIISSGSIPLPNDFDILRLSTLI